MAGLIALVGARPAMAGDPRDIVFACPCQAVWSGEPTSGMGELTLSFGVRSFRATESGEVAVGRGFEDSSYHHANLGLEDSSLGPLAAGTTLTGQSITVGFRRPTEGAPITIPLREAVARDPDGPRWAHREFLTLWPVPGENADRVEFVDILTDTDGDGASDVNERLAETSESSAASRPGESTIDVVALFNDGFREAFGGYPYTRIHHVMTLANAMFVDSGTNIRIRTVGMSEVVLNERGVPDPDDRTALMDRHGADLAFRFHNGGPMGCWSGVAGCATIEGWLGRGRWQGYRIGIAVSLGHASATVTAHELGHNLGLAHSALQGEAYGAFRWSRGHYIDQFSGTIMSYGVRILGGVFSDPGADCGSAPCGVPRDETDGANAMLSLDLVRHQVAAHRASKRDTDGDGIVDVADDLPNDPSEHVDSDGDGIGDLADPDDDNDGVADRDDPFPLDPDEWEDADGDGIGDNEDTDVADLSPFRDAALRAAVEKALGKAPGAPISPEELADLAELQAQDLGIRDLTGLELAENLETLNLWRNEVASLTALSDLRQLRRLYLNYNRVSDLRPLEELAGLSLLNVVGNPVSDLSPVAELRQLESLWLGQSGHVVSDPSHLAGLTMLRQLYADGIGLSDLSPVQGLAALNSLQIPNNPVSDLSPLSDMTQLRSLNLNGTKVVDLSLLAGLRLRSLRVDDTGVSLDDVVALPHAGDLSSLGLKGLGIDDISALSNFGSLRFLWLGWNGISDLEPLRGLTETRLLDLEGNDVSNIAALGRLPNLQSLYLAGNNVSDLNALTGLSSLRWLELRRNQVSDLAPLVRREIWDLDSSPGVNLYGNPLDSASVHEHVPKLESWGIRVWGAGHAAVAIPDPALRALIAQAIAGARVRLDDPITEESIKRLVILQAFNAGIADLAGLDAAANLTWAWLGSNHISNVGPLAAAHELAGLDLSDNRISNVGPLTDNPGISAGDWVSLSANPLSEQSLNVHIPDLLDRNVDVRLDSVTLLVRIGGGRVTLDTSGYFRAVLGDVSRITASDPGADIAVVEMVDGTLRAMPVESGTVSVTVEATAADNTTASLVFLLAVRQGPQLLQTAVTATEIGVEGASEHIPLARLFVAEDEQPLVFTARSSDPGLVRVHIEGGVLTLTSSDSAREGTATVTVTATDAFGLSATLTFEVTVAVSARGLLRGWLRAWLEQERARRETGTED
ncbi:MAG: hypothetical protein OXI90_12430 [Gammaproteobacteria bacterium]|nr:hypothetical protein [Gammaproteobacteria bacterium]